ncbi:hypothetical protein GTF97_21340 [Roseobacter sp. HKCCD8767]|uniref:ABC transporter ATP-binding protein n=3 Tax=unclassified Roseobacter TaxID=196798 RepID=UPI00149200E2|nr:MULTISPECIES: ABC transporter ATP-binding protein [unclassified Roseobacter]MBF9052526.1 hypothetical protein [Rhodobacterales bacterium HKCCD4356]NNV32455.1 hypothetical protein [Roseobacter sp. HKCCD9061]NNV53726.1 hypothetical protein [Roseobacter sp. HKCCD9025]NNV83542.1 hypothetical protein [Roseobacter sp. HKCCD6547]NNV96312.1 hypothetical protein [Roseobacter sp. HKCCD8914]NNW13342.1 hypothetical protein [Roseobacter sp. HKCCD8484]NNW21864.1 hypothetical protein [Roseobacter sp. HK
MRLRCGPAASASALLAMAYTQETPWMLLDEPLAALDPKYVHYIMDRLKTIATKDRSVVIVLHDLSVAAQYADWRVSIKDGTIFSSGPWQDTMASDALTKLYETPLRLDHVSTGEPVVISG